MFKKYLLPLIAGTVFAAVIPSTKAVDTGTITFTGKIIPDTCNVKVNDAGADGTVMFKTLSQTSFGVDQQVGDRQPFKITVSDCDATTINKLNIKFTGTRIEGYGDQILATTAADTNLGVRIAPENTSNYIKFDGSASTLDKIVVQGQDAVFNYVAEVVQVGSVLPKTGDYSAQATYTLLYP